MHAACISEVNCYWIVQLAKPRENMAEERASAHFVGSDTPGSKFICICLQDLGAGARRAIDFVF